MSIYFNDLEFDMSGNDIQKFQLNQTELMFVKPLKTIYRLKKYKSERQDEWIALKFHKTEFGYFRTQINQKHYYEHRLIFFAYNQDWDISDCSVKTNSIDHIDGDKKNNDIENLRKVTAQQNQWNRTKAKGYYWNKGKNKWQAQIMVDGIVKFLGCFDTETEARQAYLNIKEIVHMIP